jgi:predicted dehydrogenase
LEEKKAEEKARKFGAERVYTSYESMLTLDLDLVDIVTPTPTHADLAVRALESGHNVLVEKPMALTSQECLDMITAARRSGKTLCICHNKRFYDAVVKTKRAIEQERLMASRMRVAHYFIYEHLRPDWILTEETGGVLWEAMVHHTYLLQHFLGKTDRVYAVAKRIRHPVYDSITLILQGKGGDGIGEYERYAKAPFLGFQLFTQQGDRFDGDLFNDFVARWSSRHPDGTPRYLRRFARDLAIPFLKWRSRLQNPSIPSPYGQVTPYKRTFVMLIGQLLSSLRTQKPVPPVTAEEGLRTIRVLEAARESIATGETQSLMQ